MATSPKRASITLDGETFEIKAGTAKLTVGGPSGTAVVTDAGVVHTSYEPKEGMLECTLVMTPAQTSAVESKLRTLQDATGTFTWIGGTSYSLTGVSANEAGTWSQDGDGLQVKFHMNPAQPM